jgi:hypothetical protein
MPHLCGKISNGRLRRQWIEEEAVVRPHEEVARIAQSYWEARGRQGGSPEEDWYRAEREWDARNGRG